MSGTTCRCGSIGCWETEVGEPALLARAGLPVDGGRTAVDAVLAQAAAGDATALAALAEVGLWLGIGLAGLVNMLNPARVVLGGHLASLHRFVATTIEDTLDRRALGAPRALVEIVPATLGVDAAVLGAAELAFEPILADPASWFNGPGAATAPAGPLGHRPRGGTRHMSKFSRSHRGPRYGEETRMHARRSAALIMGAALVLVAACGDDDDSGGASATTAAGGAATTTAGGGATTTEGGAPATTTAGGGGDCVVGVSWNNYQEERWAKWDEPAIKAAIEAGGGSYISNDAKSSAETQASNVENLISQGANVLIILAQDGTAIKPSVASAIANGVPVIAYDRLIEDPGALYITFDNVEVGRMQARGDLRPGARRATTSSSRATRPTPTPTSCAAATRRSSATPSTAGDIKIVGETYTDNWDPGHGPDRDGAVPHGRATTTSTPCSPRTTAWPVASSPPSRPRASPARSRCPVRTATRPPSTGSRSARRRSTSGRTPASSARPPARPPSRSAPTPTSAAVAGHRAVHDAGWQRRHLDPAQAASRSRQDNLDVVLDAGWIDKATLCQGVEAGSVAGLRLTGATSVA